VLKVFCYEERAKADFSERNEDLRKTTTTANILANMLMPIMGNMSNVIYAILALTGGLLAIRGGGLLTLGSIASFLTLSKNFNRPVSQISQQINSVVMALAGAQRVFDLIDEKPEEDEGDVTLVNVNVAEDGSLSETEGFTGAWAWKVPQKPGSPELVRLRGDVRMKDVDFSYVPERQILYDINLYAKPGQKIAFVGSTGAGKTTITNLINRFYDIQDGQITYDGIDIKRIRKNNLRKSLGMVLQDVNLFTGTIRDNIRYGRLSATDEEVVEAAKLANAHSFIEKLPEGYDTVISGTGSQLSQGQCQLISIARCAVANPPVMILDEATSSIDTRTEALIQSGMDSLMHGRTVFVIAHRLSTVQNSNAIMVLEKGRIVERGDHDDLIAQKGRYYQLYTGRAE
jgi:ATP-binding cassette subfamily B protein